MKPDSLIHLRVPAATKGRWVRASRADGVRLTDWIVNFVEEKMEQQATKIPPGRPETIKGKACNVYLDADSLATAGRLGDGNVSAGIREALKRASR
jgi:post-segregation antitoxin (ccd killing protein)